MADFKLKALKVIKDCNELGLVTNKGTVSPECGWTQLLILAHEVMLFCVYLAFILGTISIAYSGWMMISAGGNSGQIDKAKGIFSKVIWGIIITLCAYLFVQTILKYLGLNEAYSLLLKG